MLLCPLCKKQMKNDGIESFRMSFKGSNTPVKKIKHYICKDCRLSVIVESKYNYILWKENKDK